MVKPMIDTTNAQSQLHIKKIQVKNFFKKFEHKQVHNGVTFDVRQNECLGLIGGSGSGKSVLLRSLIGLEKPDEGEIWIDGIEISKFSEADLISVRKKVAYAFQGGALFDSMTVFDNLSFPLLEHTKFTLPEIKEIVLKQLADFGLAQCEYLYPARLSGGMQKRVGLARAMMLEPEVILYDEPTAGLDPFNTKKIQETILNLKSRGTTSILVTHDIPTAFAVCDRLAFLLDGKILIAQSLQEIEHDKNSIVQKFLRGE